MMAEYNFKWLKPLFVFHLPHAGPDGDLAFRLVFVVANIDAGCNGLQLDYFSLGNLFSDYVMGSSLFENRDVCCSI